MLPVAIFRFAPTETPGHFGEWLDAQGIAWRLVALDEGAAVPVSPRDFAGIGMMGGPMSVNDDLPWVAPLTGLLRDAMMEGTPVIGHCLGGQLMAKALGARVARRVERTKGRRSGVGAGVGAAAAGFGVAGRGAGVGATGSSLSSSLTTSM